MLIDAFVTMLNQSFYTDMEMGCLDLHGPAGSLGGIVSAAHVEYLLQHPAHAAAFRGFSSRTSINEK